MVRDATPSLGGRRDETHPCWCEKRTVSARRGWRKQQEPAPTVTIAAPVETLSLPMVVNMQMNERETMPWSEDGVDDDDADRELSPTR